MLPLSLKSFAPLINLLEIIQYPFYHYFTSYEIVFHRFKTHTVLCYQFMCRHLFLIVKLTEKNNRYKYKISRIKIYMHTYNLYVLC